MSGELIDVADLLEIRDDLRVKRDKLAARAARECVGRVAGKRRPGSYRRAVQLEAQARHVDGLIERARVINEKAEDGVIAGRLSPEDWMALRSIQDRIGVDL